MFTSLETAGSFANGFMQAMTFYRLRVNPTKVHKKKARAQR